MSGATPLEREPSPPPARVWARALRRPARGELAVGLLAGLLGLALNRVELTLVPAVQLIFGPLAVLAAAVLRGPVAGGLAGALAGFTTYVMWGHPWAWLGMALEGAAVGALSRRVPPVRATALYWLFGLPYVLASYTLGPQVPVADAALVGLKQCANSLLAALLVYVVLLTPWVRARLPGALPRPLRSVGLADAVSAALMLGTVLPLVVVGALQGRTRYAEGRRQLDVQNASAARMVSDAVGRSLAAGQRSATILAGVLSDHAARSGGRLPPNAELQQLLARWVDNSPSLVGAYVGDAQGRAVAVYPPDIVQPSGVEYLQYADRDYFAELQRTRRPLLTGLFQGRATRGLVVAAVAPVLHDGALAGYVFLGLDVRSLRELARGRILESQRVRLVDPRGLLVVDSASDSASSAGAPTAPPVDVQSLPLGAALAKATPGQAGEYSAEPGTVTLRQVRASHAFALQALPQLGWRVVVEQPLGFVDRAALQAYAALAGSLGLALLLVLLGARALARVVARPLEAVSAAAQRFARGERSARAGGAGTQGTAEVQRLAAAFDAMADELGAQLAALEHARGERDQFLSVASHELKTPLATLKAQVQLLQRRLPEAEQDTAPRLLRQLDRITRLVNLMLDVSELESGRLQLERRPLALDALVREAAPQRTAASPRHLLRLRLAPAQVVGDAQRLEQLLHNLVDNAVKFSPEGGPVEVALEARGDEAVLSVADRGVGLGNLGPEDDGSGRLRRFPGGQQPSVARVAGLGVGLFFCREVAERHGGSLSLRPREGGGAVAILRLPLAR